MHIMKHNMKLPLGQMLFFRPATSLREFCQQLRRVENFLSIQCQQPPPRQAFRPRVHEIALDEEERVEYPSAEVDALAVVSNVLCWNCRERDRLY